MLISNFQFPISNFKSKLKIKLAFLFLIIFVVQFLIINYAFAINESDTLVRRLGEPCWDKGKCELNDFVKIAVWVWWWILSITGSIALAMFIYGGFTFLISGGSSERITKGKTILINSIIGLVIIFTSYLIVNFILDKTGYINKGSWFSPPTSSSANQCPEWSAWDEANKRCSPLEH
jgi:hypothetical protein